MRNLGNNVGRGAACVMTAARRRRPQQPNAVGNNRADGGVIGGLSWAAASLTFQTMALPTSYREEEERHGWPLKRMCQDRRAYFIFIINRTAIKQRSSMGLKYIWLFRCSICHLE